MVGGPHNLRNYFLTSSLGSRFSVCLIRKIAQIISVLSMEAFSLEKFPDKFIYTETGGRKKNSKIEKSDAQKMNAKDKDLA